jgi:hypothetical protein
MTKRVMTNVTTEGEAEEFEVTAYIQDTYVVGYIKPKPQRLGAMAFVCKVDGDGKRMDGGQVYWDVTRRHIEAFSHRTWLKANSIKAV